MKSSREGFYHRRVRTPYDPDYPSSQIGFMVYNSNATSSVKEPLIATSNEEEGEKVIQILRQKDPQG